MAETTGTTGIIAMAEQSERSSQGLPASLKAYQHDLERAAMLHPLSAACLQLWDTLLCEVVEETGPGVGLQLSAGHPIAPGRILFIGSKFIDVHARHVWYSDGWGERSAGYGKNTL